ncbi:MAG: MFS transporter [Thermoplasmata archaeon]
MNNDVKKIIFSRFFLSFSYGALNVIVSIYLHLEGFNNLTIGVILSLGILINAVIAFVFAVLADHFGRKYILILILILFSISSYLFINIKNPYIISILIGIGGFTGVGGGPIGSGGATGTIMTAIISENVERKNYSKILGIASSIGIVGTILGSFTITIFDIYNIDYVNIFYLSIINGLISASIILFIKDNRIRNPRLWPSISWKKIIKLSIPTIPGGLSSGLITPFFSLWFVERYQVSPGLVGAIFAISNIFTITTMVLLPYMISGNGKSELNTIIITRGLGSLFLILIGLSPNILLASIFFILRNGFQMGSIPIRQSFSLGVVDEKERATVSGATTLSRIGSSSLTPAIGSSLMNYTIELPPILSGIVNIFDPLLYYLLFKKEFHNKN